MAIKVAIEDIYREPITVETSTRIDGNLKCDGGNYWRQGKTKKENGFFKAQVSKHWSCAVEI